MTSLLKSIFLLILCLWLTACGSLPTATIPPSPQPISVSISPFLEPTRDALHACATSLPEIALFVDVIPESAQDFKKSDLILWWGEKPAEVDFAYPIAADDLVVIVNPNNPNTELKAGELRALFTGQVEYWSEISTFDQPVSVWIYPKGSLLEEVFRSEFLGSQRFSQLAYLAPSPLAMLEAVADDRGGIGIIPRSWLSPEISYIQVEPDLQSTLRKPILVLTESEPRAGLRDLLICLQTGEGQRELLDQYSPQ